MNIPRGCDGSVLLDGSASEPSEKDAPPNLTLRAQAFVIIENLRRLVHKDCGPVVSCSDITTLAARDAVVMSGGPDYSVPLGRRDGLTFATRNVTLANLPPPFAKTNAILNSLSQKGFTPTDVVALSGGHTIGLAHCISFTTRLYPIIDPTLDQTFYKNLKIICPTINSTNTTFMDIRSPETFDNKYYIDLINRQGLLTSDQDLYTDIMTQSIVKNFAGQDGKLASHLAPIVFRNVRYHETMHDNNHPCYQKLGHHRCCVLIPHHRCRTLSIHTIYIPGHKTRPWTKHLLAPSSVYTQTPPPMPPRSWTFGVFDAKYFVDLIPRFVH
ncbi:hypothetical protein E3N88_15249 [Mikania micrantha]|uniref:Peroxidase n=1 Tax=Mikania micrantha TaxID=192012 RepID=A0A5N6NV33_9ASTR|nr:hypothetical protein E3N88_15249 [Mikania micrantha]